MNYLVFYAQMFGLFLGFIFIAAVILYGINKASGDDVGETDERRVEDRNPTA